MKLQPILTTLALIAFTCLTGCSTAKGTGSLAGAGVGTLIGAAVGDTQSAIIGAAIGTGVGYIIGDQVDEKHAKEMSTKGTTHNEVGPLGNTKWQVRSVTTAKPLAPYASKLVDFRPDGHVITTTTTSDGKVEVFDESYRVVGDTLIINKPGYLINAKFKIDGQELILTDPGFSAVLTRLSA
jgi:hypothetical protein